MAHSVQHISPSHHLGHWFHTLTNFRTNVYQRYATQAETKIAIRASVAEHKPPLSIIRRRALQKASETTYCVQLFPKAYLQDDIDVMLAALLIFVKDPC